MLMLKQGVQTINTQFIQTRALPKFSFIQFRPNATLFVRLLHSRTLISKSKKTLKMNLDLTPLFKTSVDCWRKGWGSCFECGLFGKLVPLIHSKQIWQKKISVVHTRFFLWIVWFCDFSFCTEFLHC